MKCRSFTLMVLLLPVALASSLSAQKDSLTRIRPTATPATTAATAAAAATPDTTVPKKKGMFGKMKDVAKNRTVQTVAKVAACTMVPGGQFVASAIDASNAKGVGGAASAAAGAATGTACMPGGMGGMGGAAGMAGRGGGMGGMANAASAAQAQSAMQQNVANGGVTSSAHNTISAASPAQQAQATANAQAAAANAQQMQAMMPSPQQMAQMQAMMAAGQANGFSSESPGKVLDLSGAPAAEIKKGKLVVKNVDWVMKAPGVSAAGSPGFTQLMTSVAQAMKENGGSYRVDIYMDKHYTDGESNGLGPQRIATILAALQAGDVAVAGNVHRDNPQRIEFVKVK